MSMTETYVELQEIRVLRFRAEMGGKGPSAAFEYVESKLPTLKGRKFYGTFRDTPEGEEYYACVAQMESDDPDRMELGTGVIPGGWYARRILRDWEQNLSLLPKIFGEMARAVDVDPGRPSLEYYRSQAELHLLLPVRAH
jgi:hypothetical protein